jgi:hydroxymethylpyrimidine kinase/phosphomethylpyrimidine kinase
VALTIAGSDSGGGAGVQGDLLTFAAHGVHGTCAITCVTAQSSVQVASWTAVDPSLVVRQIETVAADMPPSAAKTGMLGTPEVVEAVARCLSRLRLPALVVDPVLGATQGGRLLVPGAEALYLERLLPMATVFTPNIPEAETLLGRRIGGPDEMADAARALIERGAQAVVVKGGHLSGDAIDVYLDQSGEVEQLWGPRIPTRSTHGTGCAFSASLTAHLAAGVPVREAARRAKRYVAEAMRRGYAPGAGPGVLDHLFPLRGE